MNLFQFIKGLFLVEPEDYLPSMIWEPEHKIIIITSISQYKPKSSTVQCFIKSLNIVLFSIEHSM